MTSAGQDESRHNEFSPPPTDQHPADQHPADQHPADQHPADQHPAEQHSADTACLARAWRETANLDRPGRLLDAAVRIMPAARRGWGRAMQAELAAVEGKRDRWSFARGCLRAAAVQFHLVRGALHLLVVLGILGILLVWISAVDYQPLSWVLFLIVSALAAVCWEGRRAGMLGPVGDGAAAWLLRVCGYLIAGGIAVVAVTHARPTTLEAIDTGVGILVFATIPTGYLLGLATACARRSAAGARVLVTGAGSGFGAAAVWLIITLVAPPIPDSVGRALLLTAIASAIAGAANARPPKAAPPGPVQTGPIQTGPIRTGPIQTGPIRTGPIQTGPVRTGLAESYAGTRGLLAALLAAATAMGLIFLSVALLAHNGPDWVIPRITPDALPGYLVSESRIEIVDPYVVILVLGGLVSSALGLTGVLTRRPAAGNRRAAGNRPAAGNH